MSSIKKLLIVSLFVSNVIFTSEIEKLTSSLEKDIVTVEQLEQKYNEIITKKITKEESLKELFALKIEAKKLLNELSLFNKILFLVPSVITTLALSEKKYLNVDLKNNSLDRIIRAAANEINKREHYENDLLHLKTFEIEKGINYKDLSQKYSCPHVEQNKHVCDKICNYEMLQKYISLELKSSSMPYYIAQLSIGLFSAYILYTIPKTYTQIQKLNLLLENIQCAEEFIIKTNIY